MSETAQTTAKNAGAGPGLSIIDNQLVVSGCLDVDNVGVLRNQGVALLDTLLSGSTQAVAVDLAGIEAHGSAVIALLIAWQRHLIRQERKVRFVNASEELRAIAAACGVEDILALA